MKQAVTKTTTAIALLLLISPFMMAGTAQAQDNVEIFLETFDADPGITGTQQISNDGVYDNQDLTFTGNTDTRTTLAGSGYDGSSGARNVFFGTAGGNPPRDLTISGIDTEGFNSYNLSFGINTGNIANKLIVEYSTNGVDFTEIEYDVTANNWSLVTIEYISLPATDDLTLRFSKIDNEQYRLDDIRLAGNENTEAPAALADLIFSPEDIDFYPDMEVEITSPDGGTIYYTTDDSDPTTGSTVYTGAILISETTTIKAIAEDDGVESDIASATYTFVIPETAELPYTEDFETDLGQMYVHSVSGSSQWEWTDNDGGVAESNGFQSTGIANDWLIFPMIDLEDVHLPTLTFETARSFGDAGMTDDHFLKLMYSTNYDGVGDPTNADWTELTFEPATGSTYTASGVIDLSGIDTEVHLAFQYYYIDAFTRWRVDNISIMETEQVEASITFANLQSPEQATVGVGRTVPATARVFVDDYTGTGESRSLISGWIGISSEDTDPESWPDTTWVAATFSSSIDDTYDEYTADIGANTMEAGDYYIASRFQLDDGDYVYGGFETDGGGIWDGTTNVSGELTVIDVVAAPVISPEGGIQFEEEVEVTITSATETATIYYTTNGDDPDETSTEYTGAFTIDEETTVKAIAYADDLDVSDIVSEAYTFEEYIEVSSIAELHAVDPDGETIYRITDEVVLYLTYNNRNQKFIFDETAAVLIDDPSGVITTEYELFDGITGVTGTLSMFHETLQISPVFDPGAATSEDNDFYAPVYGLDEIVAEDNVLQLVFVQDVTFDESGEFEDNANYTVRDANDNTMVFRTQRTGEWDSGFDGESIPEGSVNILAYVGVYQGEPQLYGYFYHFIFDADAIAPFSLEAPENEAGVVVSDSPDHTIDISWEAATGAAEYTWIATLPEYEFWMPLLSVDSDEPSISFTHEELDEILVDLGVEADSSVTLKWKVIAINDDDGGARFSSEVFTVVLTRGELDETETETETDTSTENLELPTEVSLSQNYPNPFNPTTQIQFGLPADAQVTLVVYDMLGRQVATLVNDNLQAGYHTVNFDATRLASGLYIYRMQTGTKMITRKMLLVK